MQLMHISKQNPGTPLKAMLALRFLRAYSRINRHKSSSPVTASSSSSAIIRRSKMIKNAAYASMACAAGPKKAWSRALRRNLLRRRSLRGPKMSDFSMSKGKVSGVGVLAGEAISRADELRRLVPGAKSMDFSSLLGETADYIQCLAAQVNVMQGIADSLSPQPWS